jgi:hypothetical protein
LRKATMGKLQLKMIIFISNETHWFAKRGGSGNFFLKIKNSR